jgi:hypothetical protein
MRLREAGVPDKTRAAILWHSNESINDHYSMAMVQEIFEALEKIREEGSGWKKSLQSLIFEARERRVTQKSPREMKRDYVL